MFCVNCGSSVEGNALAICAHCGKSNQPAFSAADAGRIAKAAAADALGAVRKIAADPISGLQAAYADLGEQRACSAGIALGLAFALAIGVAAAITASSLGLGNSIKFMLSMTVLGLVAFVAMVAASAGARKAFRTDGTAGADLLSCGVALQPFSVLLLVAAALGLANVKTIALLSLFAWAYTMTILFTGCTKLVRIPDRFAPPVMAMMLLAAVWAVQLTGGWLVGANPFAPFFGW
jgi:hypothetical protein